MISRKRNKYSLWLNMSSLCVAIVITLILNVAIDGNYIERRVNVYYYSYLGIFYSILLLLFTVPVVFSDVRQRNCWLYLLYGVAFGALAGLLAYLFGIQVDIFSVKKGFHKVTSEQGFVELAFLSLVFPTMILRSWLYGLIAGQILHQGLKLVHRWTEQ